LKKTNIKLYNIEKKTLNSLLIPSYVYMHITNFPATHRLANGEADLQCFRDCGSILSLKTRISQRSLLHIINLLQHFHHLLWPEFPYQLHIMQCHFSCRVTTCRCNGGPG